MMIKDYITTSIDKIENEIDFDYYDTKNDDNYQIKKVLFS